MPDLSDSSKTILAALLEKNLEKSIALKDKQRRLLEALSAAAQELPDVEPTSPEGSACQPGTTPADQARP
jgi:hypothetical protein